MLRTRVKMCGTTSARDAMAAVEAGVDALGFIFVKKSPRYISPDDAASIIDILPPFVTKVGVFVDSRPKDIIETITYCGLNQVQLHGNENPQKCMEIRRANQIFSICKAFRVGVEAPPIDFSAYSPVVDSVLLDTYVKGQEGGTGETFDWDLIARLKLDRPLILAGGLSAENVREAIQSVAPYAVDVNSGIEVAPGIKDHKKLTTLLQEVRRADQEKNN